MPILDPVPGAPPRPDDFAHLPRLLRPATLGAVIFWIWAVTAGGIFYLATQYGLAGSDAGTDAFLALAFVGLAVAVFVVPGLSHSRYFTVEALGHVKREAALPGGSGADDGDDRPVDRIGHMPSPWACS